MNMIYFDNSATTKIRPEALETYINVSGEHFGNPSSLHSMGLDAEKRMDEARDAVRQALGMKDGQVIFTSGGSEANNLAIFGRAHAKERFRCGGKILTTAGEHASVSAPLSALEAEGFKIVTIPTVGGVLNMDVLKAEMTPDVILVTMMMVNNETGALYDLAGVSALMKKQSPEAVLHADATQSFGKVAFSVKSIGADMITVSSHKIEGPKGVGALYVSDAPIKNRGLVACILGGGQENGYRSGTENVPGIAAFGTACRLSTAERDDHIRTLHSLRGYLLNELQSRQDLQSVSITQPPVCAPHILNITLPGIKSETMLHYLSSKGICVSSGSACSSHGQHVSSALVSFGRSLAEADCSLRISLSYHNTEEEIRTFCDVLGEGIGRLARMRG